MPTTQDHRAFSVQSPLVKDALLFRQLSGSERVSELFEFNFELLSEDGALDADKLLGQGLTLSVGLLGGGTRFLHGVVTEFTQSGYSERFHVYRAVVRPWLWFLTRTADCRSFQDMSVPAIFEKVVKQYGFSDYKLKLQSSYPAREYCVQYRETDFNFISRLLQHEGIHYYFEHSDGKHTLILADDASAHVTVTGYESVHYLPPGSNPAVRDREHLLDWSVVKQLQSGAYATTDFDFEAPRNSLAANSSISRKYAHADFEIFDAPAGLDVLDGGEAKRIAKLRIEELQSPYLIARGSGDAAGLSPGAKFKLQDYPRSDLNIDYFIIGADYTIISDAFGSGVAGSGSSLSIAVQSIDARTAYRPARVTPKPVVHGAQTAMVVGQSGEEIDTDKYGRVKVQFNWDRYAKGDDSSSCWVRVGQLWAGKQFGAIYIPRIGQEVIVDFLEGDPDRPIITGRVYNADSMPPYTLPDNKTQSGIKSRSSKGGTVDHANELRFEDKMGSEQVTLHAEKDLIIECENDGSNSVGHDQTTDIKHQLTTKVGDAETRNVTKDRTTSVGGSDSSSVGKEYTLTASDKITLVTGQASIVMEKNGDITITGNNISISGNSKIDASAMQVTISGTTKVSLSSNVDLQLKGMSTKVAGTMLELSGDAMTTVKGGMTMIG